MTIPISPVDRARIPGGVQDRLRDLETNLQAQQQKNAQTQTLANASLDPWAINASFPSICQGRLSMTTVPIPLSAQSDTIYFVNYKGNLIGLYNGSNWSEIPFDSLTLPVSVTVSATFINGSAIVTLADTSQLVVGMFIRSGGVVPEPPTTTIASIDSPTQITMSANATVSGANNVLFSVPPSSTGDVFIMDAGNGQLALRMILWNSRTVVTITNVTNASPPVVTFTPAQTIVADRIVNIRDVAGTAVTNGTYRAGTQTTTTMQLLTFAGANVGVPGAYGGGGRLQFADTNPTRASALALQDGVYVLASDPTWRYLGTFTTDMIAMAGGASSWGPANVSDTLTARNLWNYYNRIQRPMIVNDTAASWTPSASNTWLPDHNTVSNRLQFTVGIMEDSIIAKKVTSVTTNAVAGRIGLNVNSTTATPAFFLTNIGTTALRLAMNTGNINLSFYVVGGEGYSWIQGMELGATAASVTFFGNGEHLIEAFVWS